MRFLVLWSAACVVCASAAWPLASQQPPVGACDLITWSAPDTVRTPDGRAVFVEHPQIIARDGGTVLIGSWGAEVIGLPRATAGYAFTREGVVRSIPLPVAWEEWGPPRAALVDDDVIWVVWIPVDSENRDTPPLYSAELRREGWGPVSRLELPDPVYWSVVYASAPVRTGSEHRMIIPTRLGGRHRALLVRRTAAGPAVSPIAIESLNYARLVATRGDTLLLAYVAGADPDGNTLFVRRLTSDGDSIGSRIQVSVPGSGPAHDPELDIAGDSMLYLTWAVHDDRGTSRRIGLATSRDHGLTWMQHTNAMVEGGFDLISTSVDPLGRLHVVVRGDRGGEPHPMHLEWTGAQWRSAPIPPAPGVVSAGHPVMMWLPGSPRVIWAGARITETMPPMPVSFMSQGRSGCERDDTASVRDQARPATPALEERIAPTHDESTPLSIGLGTHSSVRGAAWPRAALQFERRQSNAAIWDGSAGADARRPGRRWTRVRGPPGHASRARRRAPAPDGGRRLDDDRRHRVLRIRG